MPAEASAESSRLGVPEVGQPRPTVGLAALPDGARWYAHLVRAHTTTDLEPAEMSDAEVRPGLPIFLLTCTGEQERRGATGFVSSVEPFEAFST